MPMKIQILSYFVILFLGKFNEFSAFMVYFTIFLLCVFFHGSKIFLYDKEPNSMKVRSKSEQIAKVHRVWFLGSTKGSPSYIG